VRSLLPLDPPADADQGREHLRSFSCGPVWFGQFHKESCVQQEARRFKFTGDREVIWPLTFHHVVFSILTNPTIVVLAAVDLDGHQSLLNQPR